MSHRTQITLTDEQYERLQSESERTGLSMAELIRRAVDDAYGPEPLTVDEKLQILRETAGAWKDRDFADGAEYVARIRQGIGRRLEQLE